MEEGEIISEEIPSSPAALTTTTTTSYYLTLEGPEYDYLRSVDKEYDLLPLYRLDSTVVGNRSSLEMLGMSQHSSSPSFNQSNLPSKEFSTEIINWFIANRKTNNYIYKDYSPFNLDLTLECECEDDLKDKSYLYNIIPLLSQSQLWKLLQKAQISISKIELKYYWIVRIFENLCTTPLLMHHANALRQICKEMIELRDSLNGDVGHRGDDIFYLNTMIIIITNCFSQYDLFRCSQ